MKLLFPALFVTVSLAGPLPQAQVEPPLTDLLTQGELREYQRKPKYKDRIDLFREVFDRRVDLLQRYIQRGQLEETADLLHSITALSHHTTAESSNVENDKDLRSTEVKKLEIRLRKLIEIIDDLGTTVPYEYLDGFENSIQALEQLRKTLLAQLLGEAMVDNRSAKTPARISHTQSTTAPDTAASTAFRDPQAGAPGLLNVLQGVRLRGSTRKGGYPSRALYPQPSPPPRYDRCEKCGLASLSFQPAGPSLAAPRMRMQSRDRFTDEEYGKLQLHQELEKRVEVFLEISEARLKEIQRRMKGEEWEEDEENPLEFHTYWDMVHAYRKAIDGIMVNIDEKAIYKTASEDDIRSSLEKLNEKIQEFIPQLEPLKQLAIDRKDEALYVEVEEAQEISEIAHKGSLYGLGAPVP